MFIESGISVSVNDILQLNVHKISNFGFWRGAVLKTDGVTHLGRQIKLSFQCLEILKNMF